MHWKFTANTELKADVPWESWKNSLLICFGSAVLQAIRLKKSGSLIQVISSKKRLLTPPRVLYNATQSNITVILLTHYIKSETICTIHYQKLTFCLSELFLSLVMILSYMVGLKCWVRAVCASHRAFHDSVWAPAGYKCQLPPSAIGYCTSWLENAALHWRHKTLLFH